YIGVLRCKRSFDILTNFVKENEMFNLYVREKVAVGENFATQLVKLSNVRYEGLYKSPDDLYEVYREADIVWAAYPFGENEDGNWRYARTIRFYEACAFGKPVIVQKGTPQARDVEHYNIGMAVDMT